MIARPSLPALPPRSRARGLQQQTPAAETSASTSLKPRACLADPHPPPRPAPRPPHVPHDQAVVVKERRSRERKPMPEKPMSEPESVMAECEPVVYHEPIPGKPAMEAGTRHKVVCREMSAAAQAAVTAAHSGRGGIGSKCRRTERHGSRECDDTRSQHSSLLSVSHERRPRSGIFRISRSDCPHSSSALNRP